MPPPANEPSLPLAAFRSAFRADIESDCVRPLAEYLTRFPGDEDGIAHEYFVHKRGGTAEPSADRIAHYKIIREIGRGGQATVYLAEDTNLHRKVALKVLTGLGPIQGDSLDRFHREAAVASKLDHPGICGVHDAGIDHGVAYIAMRYVEGTTLASRIGTAKSASTGTGGAVSIVERAARALHAAHESGIVHRDIKPGNIMLTPKGEPVLLDFGLARDLDDGNPTLTRTGDLFGTPAYMAPEQLMAQRVRVDRRADVWSLGVTLYEALTLRRPFEAPTREAVYQAIQFKDPGSFAANPFGLHDVLGNVWEWCRDWAGGYEVKPRAGDGLRSPSASHTRVYRGGSWAVDASYARSAYRYDYTPENRFGYLGVRPARSCPRD